ncbi:MAG: hypothetical protein B7Z45_09650 [Azorhizobium sp. 12-66-6]|nr:MAG: hypothetical protein B7Z45_09650 [Azorhizobium sp. 12-66-6]
MSALFESTADTLAYIAQVAWRRRFLAFIPLLLLPPLAVVTAMVAPKRYEARMTMLVQEPSKLNPILKDISINPNLKERMSALVALAHSEVVLGKVLEDLGRIGPTTDPRDRDYMVRALSLAVNIQLVGSDIIEMRLRSGDPLSPAACKPLRGAPGLARAHIGPGQRALPEAADGRAPRQPRSGRAGLRRIPLRQCGQAAGAL